MRSICVCVTYRVSEILFGPSVCVCCVTYRMSEILCVLLHAIVMYHTIIITTAFSRICDTLHIFTHTQTVFVTYRVSEILCVLLHAIVMYNTIIITTAFSRISDTLHIITHTQTVFVTYRVSEILCVLLHATVMYIPTPYGREARRALNHVSTTLV